MLSWEITEVKATHAAWNWLVSDSPDASIFVDNDYLRAIGQASKRWVLLLNGEPVLGACIPVDSSGRALTTGAPLCMYQGLLRSSSWSKSPGDHPAEVAGYTIMLNALRDELGMYVFETSLGFTDIRQLLWYQYGQGPERIIRPEIRYSGLIDLRGFENKTASLKRLPKGRQSDLSRASKLLTLTDELSGIVFDQLHEVTFRRQGLQREPDASDRVSGIVDTSTSQGFGYNVVALRDEEPIAAAHFVTFKKIAYYLLSATKPEFRATGAGTFTVYHGLLEARNRGLEVVDVVGMNSPDRSRFKASFGAKTHVYFRCAYGVN